MPLPNYGVLVGTVMDKMDSPTAMQKNPGSKPHYQVLIDANGTKFRIAVNVKSNQQPSDLQFYMSSNYAHPILQHVKQLEPGFSRLPKQPNTAALDYIRGNLFDINDMRIVPTLLGGPNNDLNDIFDAHIQHALDTPGSLVYAFGDRWGPENNARDKYFDFLPGNGIHDIHMNQGNSGSHAGDNGIYQDGGLFIHYPDEDRWVAMFLKFQSQVVHTVDDDDEDGGTPIDVPVLPEEENAVRIFAALVNPKANDVGDEFVYLLNATDKDIDLEGWAIADKMKKKEVISDTILRAAEVTKIQLSGRAAQLSNDGGIITLLDRDGLKIDGVSYTKQDAKKQGFITVFRK
ncbi:DUF2278 family protein [Foetidibacter luteolus]|uniref:DUF2278 family protein n=1 Tax=Foetidibacter luteolus TaxID=2608880 RepID=UPI00129BD784|nr:DUF2278 family protein [Foetidibacter luteolus]